MEYIRVTKDNLEKEHICCAISSNKDVPLGIRFLQGTWILHGSVERMY